RPGEWRSRSRPRTCSRSSRGSFSRPPSEQPKLLEPAVEGPSRNADHLRRLRPVPVAGAEGREDAVALGGLVLGLVLGPRRPGRPAARARRFAPLAALSTRGRELEVVDADLLAL